MSDILTAITAVIRFLVTTDGVLSIVGAILLLFVGTSLTGHGAFVERTWERSSLGDRVFGFKDVCAAGNSDSMRPYVADIEKGRVPKGYREIRAQWVI